MSDKSICVGCVHAKWERDKIGRPRAEGTCTALAAALLDLRIPVAFYWVGGTPRPFGGHIQRKKNPWSDKHTCDFRVETKP